MNSRDTALSVHALFGYNLLLDSGGGANANLLSATLDGRWYLPLAHRIFSFVSVGAGGYFGDALASPEFGINGGVGLDLRLSFS